MLHITISKRAALIIAVALLLIVPGVALATHSFNDVVHSHPHAAGINFMADSGVSVGCGNGNYCPSDHVTRAQMGTFMHRLSGTSATPPSVNATELDGLDSTAFLKADTITMASDGSMWKPHVFNVGTISTYATWTNADGVGDVVLPLPAPVAVAGVMYILKSVELCYETFDAGYIESTLIYASGGTSTDLIFIDSTDLTGESCDVIAVNASAPRGASILLQVRDGNPDIGDPDTVDLYSVTAVWEVETF